MSEPAVWQGQPPQFLPRSERQSLATYNAEHIDRPAQREYEGLRRSETVPVQATATHSRPCTMTVATTKMTIRNEFPRLEPHRHSTLLRRPFHWEQLLLRIRGFFRPRRPRRRPLRTITIFKPRIASGPRVCLGPSTRKNSKSSITNNNLKVGIVRLRRQPWRRNCTTDSRISLVEKWTMTCKIVQE